MTALPALTAEDLRPLLRRGLPADGAVIAEPLLTLPGVTARATTTERASRVTAFDTLLRSLLARFADQRLAEAARTLFGMPADLAGTTLTVRREAAAAACAREAHHFRKHLEPRILAQLAQALAADSDRLLAVAVSAPALLPADGPAVLPAEVFAWEVAEHAEHLSRLWAHVYALRAELLACQRLASMDPHGADLRTAAERALWATGRLHGAVADYRRAYGELLLHGQVAPDVLVALAGWAPALPTGEVDVVCQHGPDVGDVRTFLRRLTAHPQGRAVHTRWVAAFVAPRTTEHTDQSGAAA
ncbi:MAG: hypothetical protein QG608_3835 [Actinomycetota bacterium]|nr:hypothetical protein [Actinomycetota bacterium]